MQAASPFVSQTYELVPIGSLKRHPKNARRGDVETISESIRKNGFYGAFVVQRSSGYILAGNHRDLALFDVLVQELGEVSAAMTDVPVIWVDVDDDRAKRILAVDNRANDLAGYDNQALAELLQELGSLEGTGYTSDDLNAILADLEDQASPKPTAPEPEIDRADELAEKWGVRSGQIWQIGLHRLMCGDSRQESAVRLLAGENKASCVWMDPPYGVDYVGKTGKALTIENDSIDGLKDLLVQAFTNAGLVARPSMPFYIASPSGPASFEFSDAIREVKWRCHQILAWVKDSMVLGHSDYHYRHESLFYGFTPGPGRPGRGAHRGSRWFGDNSQTSVIEIPRPKKSEEHPTMKPPELVAYCLANSTRPRDIVLDLFVGSGSTMVAADQLGRVCYGMDVDPRYVAVTLERLSAMGREPALVHDATES